VSRPLPWIVLLAAMGAGACGWHAGLTAPGGASSVGIDVFTAERHILERDLEPRLNAAMTRAFVDLIDVPLENPRKADLVIKGEIVEYRRRAGVRNEDNDLVETGLRIEATARLVDRKTGQIVVPSRTAYVWSSYGLDGVTAVEQEDLARERALRHIAETLILDLFRPGGENPPAPEQPQG
jgi:hypothetical protein